MSAIIAQNPQAIIFTAGDVAQKLEQGIPRTVVSAGHQAVCGSFRLDFFGGRHATVHQSIPPPENIGVLVNKLVYYPGDSFTVPHQPIDILAVPASAPWLKTAEAMDFIITLKPKLIIPSHDALMSQIGQNITDPLLKMACDQVGADFTRLPVAGHINL